MRPPPRAQAARVGASARVRGPSIDGARRRGAPARTARWAGSSRARDMDVRRRPQRIDENTRHFSLTSHGTTLAQDTPTTTARPPTLGIDGHNREHRFCSSPTAEPVRGPPLGTSNRLTFDGHGVTGSLRTPSRAAGLRLPGPLGSTLVGPGSLAWLSSLTYLRSYFSSFALTSLFSYFALLLLRSSLARSDSSLLDLVAWYVGRQPLLLF